MTIPTDQQALPAKITGSFNIALTQSKFQQLADEERRLVYNEDNLETVAEFLKKLRAVKKAIDQTHKDGKEEALRISREWDLGKRIFYATVESIEEVPQKKYEEMCRSVQLKAQAAEQERQRVTSIKTGIEQNAINFARRIAECTTMSELTKIERFINLEKTRKEYQEFLADAVVRYTELNSIVKTQKAIVKNLEELKAKEAEAALKQDDEAQMKLQEQIEAANAQVEENRTVVQETAINQSINGSSFTPVIPITTPKARRTTWKWEVVDQREVMKKTPELVVFSVDEEKVKEKMATLKQAGLFDGKQEYVLNGIRYYESKTF